MMQTSTKSIIMFLTVIVLAGCWDRTELNDVSIVTGIAIDQGENHKYKLTVEVINPTENAKVQAQGFTGSITYSQEGDSLSELANRMNVGMSRELIYSHTRVVVFTEAVAKKGLIGFLDYLERSGEFRNDFNMLLYEGDKASDVLKVTYALQKVSSLKVNRQIQTFYQNWGGDPNIRLTDFISAITSKGREPVLATIKIKGNPQKGENVENIQQVEPDALVEVSGLGVFKEDKLIGKLPITDTRNYLWINGLETTNLTIPCDDKGNYLGVRIKSSNTEVKAEVHQGKPTFKVSIKAEGKIDGSQCTEDLEKLETYKKIEDRTESFVEEEVSNTIKTLQEKYEADIFGFGETLERQHYDLYKTLEKDWDQHFADATIEVESTIYIRRSGVRGKSFQTENKEAE
ncbi:spore germination protein KC [Bacillus mesophilus]|uniref:Ger(X)C family spore germination protein n=1 Tax=Bacillus mesophilus TaxID=1808955 RepID=A0A6M0QE65_9BACI|nr:Ger(x)C family spore germination protein [Bacillus mesophilus]MBM7663190.1 spore germination protein KC [Bacillus mesophilus]NEY73970.1 Ger(x)C family spore germination protein [Bacillus mesophilus]